MKRVKKFFIYRKIFVKTSDIFKYYIIKKGKLRAKEPIAFKVKSIGDHCLSMRPGTTDSEVFAETFCMNYHLPPIELPSDCTILDLGSNVGYTAAHFAHQYPQSTVILVEMDKGNMELAKKNLEFAREQCFFIEAALWPTKGTVYYGGENEWGYHVVTGMDNDEELRPAQTITMEEIFNRFQLEFVDYVKMDIEGAEGEIFRSNLDWLDRVGCLRIECHPQYNEHATYENLEKALSSRGFQCQLEGEYVTFIMAVRNDSQPCLANTCFREN